MAVIGSGLLSREFIKSSINDDIVIIAAGVSNSKETRTEEFNREENLLKNLILENKNKKIIYFSTCSIMQSEITPYIQHKIKMEEIIRSSEIHYYIFRLPQVVGVVNNNTLISFLVRNAYLNNILKIQENAVRNLLDIEDVVKIVNLILKSDNSDKGTTVSITSSSYIRVYDIAEKIISLLKSNSDIITVPGGEEYHIENSFLKNYIGEGDKLFSDNYSIDVIEKYTNKIKAEFSCYWDILK